MRWADGRDDTWLLWQDECWFSRFAQPSVHDWGGIQLVARQSAKKESAKALACYGALRDDNRQMQLMFCEGQPNSDNTLRFLEQLLDMAATEGKQAVILIWDHASWHKSKRVRSWLRHYNQQAKASGDVRLLTWHLPKRSPWLNPIEAHWIHGKRAVLEAGEADLTAVELQRRLCAYYDVDPAVLHSNYHS